jgi:branched-chain amino acid transport system permease protein
MIDFVNATIRGVQIGAMYALVAVGLNITYATTNIFNFAHGEMVMVGAVMGVILWVSFGVPVLLALLGAVVIAAVLGALTERIAVRPVAHMRESAGWVLATFGVAIIVRQSFEIAVTRRPGSTDTRAFNAFLPAPFDHVRHYGRILINPTRVLPVVVLVVVLLALVWFLRRTDVGRALGAVADDREGAALRGLPVNGLSMLAFAVGAAIAALGGFVTGPILQASVTVGFGLTLKGFIAATIGGIPEIGGAAVGGMVLGLAEQYTVQYLDGSLQEPLVLGLLLLVLTLRPQGLLGRRARIV